MLDFKSMKDGGWRGVVFTLALAARCDGEKKTMFVGSEGSAPSNFK